MYIFQLAGGRSARALSTSSIQPGCPGVSTACPRSRVLPAVLLTMFTPSAIAWFDTNSHERSSKGAPLRIATDVSLLR